MREVLSRAPPSDSSVLVGAFITASLVLMGAGLGFGAGILLGLSTAVIGSLLAVSFVAIGAMVLLYHRLFHDHRIVLEYDEDLW